MGQIDTIYKAVLEGNTREVQVGVEAALKEKITADQIMQNGLIAAMKEVGRLFEAGEFFVPEMLISARAMQSALVLLKPFLAASGAKAAGRVAIGTVQGDLHDIGKNLVGMMLEGAGFEIIDLGTDVRPENFVDAVEAKHADIIALSALLTTTMPKMQETIEALKAASLRDKVKVIIGGAPVTETYAQQIGADGYGPDASAASRLAAKLMKAGHAPEAA
ncbi:MAG: corrinoid protein [Anaerolineales bacterium]|jgi:5-methyltetrahydrofolate--homocysteine methyltransferase